MQLVLKMATDSLPSSPDAASSDANTAPNSAPNSVPNSPGCNVTKAGLAKAIIAKADAKVSRSSSFKMLSPNNEKKNEKVSRSSSFKEGVSAIKTALSRNSSFKESGKVSRSGSFKEGVTALLSGVGQLAAKMSPRMSRRMNEDCSKPKVGHSISDCLADAGGLVTNIATPNSPLVNRKVNESVLQVLIQNEVGEVDTKNTQVNKGNINNQISKPEICNKALANGQINIKNNIPKIEVVTAKIIEINVKTVTTNNSNSKTEINNNSNEENKIAVSDKIAEKIQSQPGKTDGLWTSFALDFLAKDAEKEAERRKTSDAKNADPTKRASLVFGVSLKNNEPKKISIPRNITPVPNPIILDPVEHRELSNRSKHSPDGNTSKSLISKVKVGPIASKFDERGKIREEHENKSKKSLSNSKSLHSATTVNAGPKANCDKINATVRPNSWSPNHSLNIDSQTKSIPVASQNSFNLTPKSRDGLDLNLDFQTKSYDTEANQDQPVRRKVPILTKEDIEEAEISPFGVSLKHIPKYVLPPVDDKSPDAAPSTRRKSDDMRRKSDDSRRNSMLLPSLKPVSKQPVTNPLISTPTEEESGLFGVQLKTAPKREYTSKSVREITRPKSAAEVISELVSKANANLPKTPDGASVESIISSIKKARRESAPAVPKVAEKPSQAQVDSIKSAKDRGIDIWDRYWKNLRAAFTLHRHN
ncbi:unnamed protein product, partial [Meganyctiphanes norvegica]